jgi:hypothetical protein
LGFYLIPNKPERARCLLTDFNPRGELSPLVARSMEPIDDAILTSVGIQTAESD